MIATAGFNKDPDPGLVRIRNVNKNGFEIRFQEWDYLDGIHSPETVEYIVVERGDYILRDGTLLEANTVDTDATKSSQSVRK